jgi:hypothetical protein
MHIAHVTLDKKRPIAYGTFALKRIERELGRPLSSLGTDVGVTEVSALLYAGLAQLDRDITPDAVDDLIDAHLDGGGSIQPIADAVSEAIAASGWFSNPTTGGK